MTEFKFYSYQKYAFQNLLEAYTESNMQAEKFLKAFFVQHKKLGAKDRKNIANWYYTFVKNNTLLLSVFPAIDYQNLDDAFIHLLQDLSTDDLEQKKATIHRLIEEKTDISLSQKYSMPEWILNKWQTQFGDQAEDLALYALLPSKTFIRFNELIATPEKQQEILADEQLKIGYIDAIDCHFSEAKNVAKSSFFSEGYFEIQDYGSQQIGKFVGIKEHETVIDTCCGAGGKALQMASAMKNTGKIWGLDVRMHALENASDRADRAGAENIEFYEIPEVPSEVDFPFMADCVLIDAPCTGSGVFSRNPDRKYTLTEKELLRVTTLQQEILASYSKMMLPNGRLIYATCSSFYEENQGQVKTFLENHPNWKLDEEKLILPSHLHDGFYMARLIQSH